MEDSAIASVLKGWLPEGMILPREILAPGWKMNDLLDQFGRNLLTGTMTVDGKTVFAALDLDLNELNVAGTPDILPVLSTPHGIGGLDRLREESQGWSPTSAPGASWPEKKAPRAPGPSSRPTTASGWSSGRNPFLYGLQLSLVYPLSSLIRSAMYGAAFSGSATVAPCWPFSSSGSSETGNLQQHQGHLVLSPRT
jgi:hypothetical protein